VQPRVAVLLPIFQATDDRCCALTDVVLLDPLHPATRTSAILLPNEAIMQIVALDVHGFLESIYCAPIEKAFLALSSCCGKSAIRIPCQVQKASDAILGVLLLIDAIVSEL
jgi:hypothetical protein